MTGKNNDLIRIKNFFIFNYNLLKDKINKSNKKENIDIVFSWVNGDDPAHKHKKLLYLKDSNINNNIEDKAVKNYRWSNHDEIIIALKSIQYFCPWVSRIWIITDKQTPELSNFPKFFQDKIRIIDHVEIFRGYENNLPTFNSRTIETCLWRIPDLSEKFIYFNDDMFILRPVKKEDFFISNKPVLRGNYKKNNNAETTLHQQGIINGAILAKFNKTFFFKQGHAPYVLIKSSLEKLFNTHKEACEKNITYKFRSREQFLMVSLFYHNSIINKKYIVKYKRDYLHLSEETCKDSNREALIQLLMETKKNRFKFLCINDLGSLTKKIPDYKDHLPKEFFD